MINEEISTMNHLKRIIGLPTGPVLFEGHTVSVTKVDLEQIADNLDVLDRYEFSSHRKILGAVVVMAKNFLVNKLAHTVLKIALGRQWALNFQFYQTTVAVVEMTDRIKVLENRIAELENKRG